MARRSSLVRDERGRRSSSTSGLPCRINFAVGRVRSRPGPGSQPLTHGPAGRGRCSQESLPGRTRSRAQRICSFAVRVNIAGPGADGPGPALRSVAQGTPGRYGICLRLANRRQRPYRRGSPGQQATGTSRARDPGSAGTRAAGELPPTASPGARSAPRWPPFRPGMRAAVILRHWLDLSVEQTADLLNCSEGTVESQTAKVTARLRDLLTHAAVERTHP